MPTEKQCFHVNGSVTIYRVRNSLKVHNNSFRGPVLCYMWMVTQVERQTWQAIQVFWDVTPYQPANSYWCSKGL